MIPRDDPFSDPDEASEYAFDQERIAEADDAAIAARDARAIAADDPLIAAEMEEGRRHEPSLAAARMQLSDDFGVYGVSAGDSTYDLVRAVAEEFGRGLRNEDVEALAGEVETLLLDGRPTSEIVEHLAKRFAERP